MNNNKITILFVLQKNRINKQNKCPIRCRITHNKKRKIFSTGFFINPEFWYNKEQRAKPPNKDNNFINTQLSLIKQKINQAFLFLQVNEKVFDVEDIYLKYKGKTIKKEYDVLEYYKEFIENHKKLIGVDIKQVTWNKFKYIMQDLKGFVKWKYKKNDVLLNKLNLDFLNEFEFYLKSVKNKKQITINKDIQRFKMVVKSAMVKGYINKLPFVGHKVKKVKTKVIFLTTDELKSLETIHLKQNRLQVVKDLFIFCCYTGLAYAEMNNLDVSKHIQVGFDGNEWIEMYRKKTKSKVSIPLLPKAKEILIKYNNELPKISNQRFNSYLKEIADFTGIDKNLTHHIARKTFATTVLLYNDVPMEIVSELLGHSKITITQEHYAKVVRKKVSDEVLKLKDKLYK
ncbi:MAG: site-specific integrase [Tenacibaculum sp.]|nr:site-specific integrase [Tenacibaculum sp.]